MPFPGLNIDNLQFFALIAATATGSTLIHDWVYEINRGYEQLAERLNLLGARIETFRDLCGACGANVEH